MAAPIKRGVGAFAASISAVSPAKPTGTVEGDLLVMEVQTISSAITVGGWNQVDLQYQPLQNGRTTIGVFWIIETAGGVATEITDSGNHQFARIVGIEAGTFDPTNPINVSAGGIQGDTTSVSIPGATTTVDDCLILAFTTAGDPDADSTDTQFSAWANTDLTSVTEIIDDGSRLGEGGNIGAASGIKATAGAYGATTATGATTSTRASISVAIAPVAAASSDGDLLPFFQQLIGV